MKNLKPSMTSILAGLVLLGGIYALARSDSAAPSAASGPLSRLEVSEASYNFGTISMRQGNASHEFKLKNIGTEPVLISKIYTSCMCTEATLETKDGTIGPFGMMGHGLIPRIDRVIGPGEEAKLIAVFDPAAHGPAGVGRIQRVVSLESPGSAPLELAFQAMVTP
jgi:hypothetical protein